MRLYFDEITPAESADKSPFSNEAPCLREADAVLSRTLPAITQEMIILW